MGQIIFQQACAKTSKPNNETDLMSWNAEGTKIKRPALASTQSSYTLILGNIIGEELKQYTLLICILYQRYI